MPCPSLTLPQPPNRVVPLGIDGEDASSPLGRNVQRARIGDSDRRSSRSARPGDGDSIMADSEVRPKYRTKKDIVRVISERLGAPQLHTRDLVEMTFEALIETLAQQGRVELRNFGIFQVRRMPARTARNPRTGESVMASAKNVVVFKPGKEMAERIQELPEDGFAPRATPLEGDESGEPDGLAP
jgi:nucleoid DNA-binding protein